MTVDVCTQHLPWIHSVSAANRPPSVAVLYSGLRKHTVYGLSFLVLFRCCLLTEGENKYTFNIKARQCHAT